MFYAILLILVYIMRSKILYIVHLYVCVENVHVLMLYSTQYTIMFGTVLQCFKRWILWIQPGSNRLLEFEMLSYFV